MLPWRMGSRQLLCARAVPAREPPAPRGEAGISGAGSVGQHRYAGATPGGGGGGGGGGGRGLVLDLVVIVV